MTKTDLFAFSRQCILEHPKKQETIRDLYYSALSGIKEGGSEFYECEFAYYDMLDIINDQNTEN